MKRLQIIVISGALVLFVLLFILPGTPTVSGKLKPVAESTADSEFNSHVDAAKAALDSASRIFVDAMVKNIDQAGNNSQKVGLFDSLIETLVLIKAPLLAAHYSEVKVSIAADEESLKKAADRYFFSTRFADDHLRSHLFEKAIYFYSKVLEIDSTVKEAKINLGVCYVEGSQEPMKGILLLKDVLKTDPANIKAHMNLGYFSIRSGQFDKAIERFETVMKIDPHYSEAYLYLGDAHESTGEIQKAVGYYEKYKESLADPEISAEVDAYIVKLKNKL